MFPFDYIIKNAIINNDYIKLNMLPESIQKNIAKPYCEMIYKWYNEYYRYRNFAFDLPICRFDLLLDPVTEWRTIHELRVLKLKSISCYFWR